MENKEINNLDPEDIGLKMIMGEHFHDETEAKPGAEKITRKAENPAKKVKAPAIEPKVEPHDSKEEQWMPPKAEPSMFDRLKECAKWALCCGGLNVLFFYWQQTGQMLPSAAVPSMCVCFAIMGFGIGKNATRK